MPPPQPSHLDAVPETSATNGFEDHDQPPAQRVTVPVRISPGPDQKFAADAGIASFDAETSADFRWYPLGEALPGENGCLLLPTEGTLGRTLTLTLASNRVQARHGYLSRRDVLCTSDDDRSTSIVDLSGRITEVHFELPEGLDHIGPLRLGRVDDPQWVAMDSDHTGLTVTRGEPLAVSLGDGEYELTEPLTGGHTQRFLVPATVRITIDAKLARAADDRR